MSCIKDWLIGVHISASNITDKKTRKGSSSSSIQLQRTLAKEEPQNCINYCSNAHDYNEGNQRILQTFKHIFILRIHMCLPFIKEFDFILYVLQSH